MHKVKKLFVMFIAFGVLAGRPSNAREYFDLFPTPRAISMGRAVTAIADDYTAVQYNAAGLALVQHWEAHAPDLLLVQASPSITEIKKALDDAKADSSVPIAQKLQQFDGKNADFSAQILTLAWLRNRVGVALNPFAVNASLRIRTPSLLFAKVNARFTTDTGLALAYGAPFFDNHLRLGITLRPILVRVGFEQELQNNDILSFTDPKKIAGAGWGFDADLGAQGNLDDKKIFGFAVRPMWGVTFQNVLGNKYTHAIKPDEFQGAVPPLYRKVNVGIAGRIENLGAFKPTISFELRELGVRTDAFLEHVSAGVEILLRPKNWFSTAFRGHFYKGNIGGGLAGKLGPGELELGTYAVNLGHGPGIGVDRRLYVQLAAVW